jgi:hypothetical protein
MSKYIGWFIVVSAILAIACGQRSDYLRLNALDERLDIDTRDIPVWSSGIPYRHNPDAMKR